MKITALVENVSQKDNLPAQYGLSLFVETEKGNIIVDMGQDDTSLNNFRELKFNIADINAIFVSHNHFDHMGGLQSYIDATASDNIPVYISCDSDAVLISKRLLRRRSIVSRNELISNNKDRMVFVQNITEIFPDAYACRVGQVDTDYLCKDKKLKMLDENGRLVRDDFKHELYLAIVEENAVKVISPCSHMGIINIINDAQNRFGLPVKSFVGGLHLRGSSSRSINCSASHIVNIANKLNELQLKELYTCHCTGKKAFSMLEKNLSDSILIKYFHTGTSFYI